MSTFIIIPDTQHIMRENEPFLERIESGYRHLVETRPIDAVVHLGDIVQEGGATYDEFRTARSLFAPFEKTGSPVLYATGNHDFDDVSQNARDNERDLHTFHHFFGGSRVSDDERFIGSFERGRTENSAFLVDGIVVLITEFAPRPAVLDWAKGLANDYAMYPVVYVTHAYLYDDGEPSRPGCRHHPSTIPQTRDGADGETIWNEWLRDTSNVIATFSGHHVDRFHAESIATTTEGTRIVQCFQNWQKEARGGGGKVRIATFSRNRLWLTLETYDPVTRETSDIIHYFRK